jgi:hypothetical protein
MARPPKPAEGARSRCVCGDMVEEGKPHTCTRVKAKEWVNPHADDTGEDIDWMHQLRRGQ